MAEADAFPAALAGTVAQLLPALGSSRAHPPFAVYLNGEALLIPTRTYYDRERLLACARLAGDAGVIALCLGTRHHDGHLREACLKQLLQQERAWTVPFVVHLCGEYVLEIVERIGAALPAWNAQALARYLRENPAYVATLERRSISYWNCYYRRRHPVWQDYPGRRTMAALLALQQLTPR
ncbi:hypothetical protein LSO07_10990 [Janthinobacterium sp. PLB04]|uniref:Uncharacterized protein n=1 Tax=Janthinobacterium lividum TaxID=29581 RepID=A0AAJ4MWW6_9BURK|nr:MULTISPECIES: hypothetical protein [Janthinobacterium]KAB0332170.1 hypothetical protein F3B38_11045 [Janthinobacterium lividum]QSX98362.1 hypothetical protein J3P46_10965 [Janthinobacterium lividum]UGQ38351.1 hypothetical protein LSO07_10990 [Janthinobacterium sp. PLB04]